MLHFRGLLGLWIGRGEQRHVIPPPPAQRGPPVLLPVGQRLGQRLPLALGQQQDGQHSQQGQRRVDHVVQEVAIVVPQVHEWGAESAHAAQGEHSAHTSAPVHTQTSGSLLFAELAVSLALNVIYVIVDKMKPVTSKRPN